MLIYFLVAANATGLAVLARAFEVSRPTTRGGLGGYPFLVPGRWNVFDWAVVALLTAFSALRFNVGTDYAIYLLNYTLLEPEHWQLHLERSPLDVGYTALTLLLRAISDAPYLIFWVTSVLTVVPIYATIKKKSLDPTFSLMLLIGLAFFVLPFNAIRQGVAMALNFWATTFLEKRPWAFVLINVIASTIHLTAAVAALIQLVARRWRPTILHIVVALCLASLVPFAMGWDVVRATVAAVLPRYSEYTTPDPAGVGSYLVLLAMFSYLLLSMFLSRGRARTEDAAYVTVGLAFLVVGTQYIVISRMDMYFAIFLALLVPNTLANSGLDERRKTLVKVACVVFAACFFATYLANYGDLLPYRIYPL